MLPLSPQVFAILSGLIAEHAGLHFDAGHLGVFADKVGTRAVEAGFESLLDYYYFLRYDPRGPEELDALIESLVINETYLFRELLPLETMVSGLLVPMVRAGRRPRIWCAACSTGEEPHTVAMLLAERGILDKVDLVASDISANALERARSGRLARRSIRQELPSFAQRWVSATEQGTKIHPRLTEAIEWRRINLMDGAAVAALGSFDVILCRNVLIYFADATTRKLLDRLRQSLKPGGTLFVGVSESLLRFGGQLVCEELNGVFLYKKPT
ncbi:MAG TPA: protein-glutamate O-methyltransferase CheR [Polyangia bacterium]|nr:protein-glutamate O-methyltransferase CheR [Polyangia bacterium]